MSKICNYILIITMIILIFVQVFLINKINKTKNVIAYNAQENIETPKKLEEIIEELSFLKEKKIIYAKKNNAKWVIEIKIQGSKESLLNEISKLKNYDISEYIISRNEDENSIILKISYKESA